MGSMTIYMAKELQKDNIAVNLMMPGHTATTGSDEQEVVRNQIRARLGLGGGSTFTPRQVRADNVVPLSLHLAEQTGEGITGRWISCMDYNQESGLGGFETWGVTEDVEAARAAGTL